MPYRRLKMTKSFETGICQIGGCRQHRRQAKPIAMSNALTFRAGSIARRIIHRDGGLDPARLRVVVGASGGPKWLALAQLDRAILPLWLQGRSAPLDLLGSSIGTWRFACYGQRDPLAAFDRFEEAYLAYRYEYGDTPQDITADSLAVLNAVLGENGAADILSGPMRLTAVAVRARAAPLDTERRLPLWAGLAASAMSNLISRKALGLFFERVLFHDPRSDTGFADWSIFPTRQVALSETNLKPAIMASCAIPLVLAGVRDIPGAPPGIYRDGGLLDYHFDLPFLKDDPDGLVLYPHFYPHIVPGWFDKPLKWRHRASRNAERVLLIAPTPAFVAGLPFSKIPDRKDFLRLPDTERLAYWHRVLVETKRLADELVEVVETGRLPDRLEPI